MTTSPHVRPRGLVLTALIMVALNLRIALSSVPAVVADIQASTGWSSTAIGMLTTIPVLCMGAFALLVPRLAQRIGRHRTVALALLVLTVALAARLAATVPGVLPASVFLAGVGIALAGGLVPSIVREQLPTSVGMATGMWTAAMMTGAAIGGALTVPLADALDSWPKALAFWAIPAAIGLVVWWFVEGGHEEVPPTEGTAGAEVTPVRIRELPWRDSRAWSLTGYLALNSIVFYSALAWLARSYQDQGSTQSDAGVLLGLFTASQIVSALFMPALAERASARRLVYTLTIGVVLVCVVAVGWAPMTLTVPVVLLFGAAIGGCFAMGLALLSEYGVDAPASARLTAMAFFVTYVTGALGPLTAGALLDVFDSWHAVYGLLALACIAQFATVPALKRGVRIG